MVMTALGAAAIWRTTRVWPMGGYPKIDYKVTKTSFAYRQSGDWKPLPMADKGRSSSSSGTCLAIQPVKVLLLGPGKTL